VSFKVENVRAFDIMYPFSKHFGEGNVPADILTPASHFQRIKRTGQAMTWVVVEDDSGRIGTGECFGLPSPLPSRALVDEVLAPALRGIEVEEPDDALSELRSYFLALGNSRGPAMEALSGIDVALWDLLAQRDDTSLAQKLGSDRAPVPTYGSPIPLCSTVQQSAESALALAELGFRAVKLKIGRGPAMDAEHVAAVRDAVGPDIQLMLDANCGYDLRGALELIDAIEKFAIRWLEEPLDPEDFVSLEKLCRSSTVSIAGGENDFEARSFERLANIGVGVLQPNITRAGGVSGMLKVHQIAETANVIVAPHGVGGSIGVAAALHCCSALSRIQIFEANRLLNPLRDDVGVKFQLDPLGNIMPPPGPGHGGKPRRNLEVFEGDVWDAFEGEKYSKTETLEKIL